MADSEHVCDATQRLVTCAMLRGVPVAIKLHRDRVVGHRGTSREGRRASVESPHGFSRDSEVFQSKGCGNGRGVSGHGKVLRARCDTLQKLRVFAVSVIN